MCLHHDQGDPLPSRKTSSRLSPSGRIAGRRGTLRLRTHPLPSRRSTHPFGRDSPLSRMISQRFAPCAKSVSGWWVRPPTWIMSPTLTSAPTRFLSTCKDFSVVVSTCFQNTVIMLAKKAGWLPLKNIDIGFVRNREENFFFENDIFLRSKGRFISKEAIPPFLVKMTAPKMTSKIMLRLHSSPNPNLDDFAIVFRASALKAAHRCWIVGQCHSAE